MADVLPDLALYESTLSSMSKSAESVANLLSESTGDNLPTYPDGISLLSLKNSILLSYMHNMTLLALCKLEGRSLEKDDQVRKVLVERLIRERVILEKIKPLEAKLKYQVDKLVKKAEDADRIVREGGRPEDDEEIGNDPLAFKPNLAGFGAADASADEDDEQDRPKASSSGIYRPPRLAPLPYNEETRGKKERARPAANALVRDMAYSLTNAASNPYAESTSGLGVTPTLQSRKANKLAEIERYEEENYTRIFMNKKDAKRRRMDEEDLALGGTGSREDFLTGAKGIRGFRTHGFENEFNDLLGGIAKKNKTGAADGYDGLRAMRRPKQAVDTNSELVNVNGVQPGEGGGRQRKSKMDNAMRRQAQHKARSNKKRT